MLKKLLYFLGKIANSRLFAFTLYFICEICLINLVEIRYPDYAPMFVHTQFILFHILLIGLIFNVKIVREDE